MCFTKDYNYAIPCSDLEVIVEARVTAAPADQPQKPRPTQLLQHRLRHGPVSQDARLCRQRTDSVVAERQVEIALGERASTVGEISGEVVHTRSIARGNVHLLKDIDGGQSVVGTAGVGEEAREEVCSGCIAEDHHPHHDGHQHVHH